MGEPSLATALAVAEAAEVEVLTAFALPVALAEDLLATKVLAMTERRLQDRIDAQKLLTFRKDLDLGLVRARLALITARGFDRNQDLEAKLDALLRPDD